MKVIEKTGFLSYFLIVGDSSGMAGKGISCVARVPPPVQSSPTCSKFRTSIRFATACFSNVFESGTCQPADIDIDFADDRRADVIEYVREKYGRDAVAQIVTFGTMGAKSVVRDVGRSWVSSYGSVIGSQNGSG